MIVDPWGKTVAILDDGPGFISAEVDLDYLTQVRREMPCLAHRRLLDID
jgi:deaminated glutathione amidase